MGANDDASLFDHFVASLEANENTLKDYVVALKDFNLSNGLIFLSKGSETRLHDQAIPLPVTLYPTKFPANEFYYALELQSHVNELTHLISNDHEFLKEALKNVVKVDDFTRRLWEIYETVRNEGIVQPVSFGILRNDFMLDQNKTGNELTCLSQIEINTVSASFGSATTNVNRLHKYLLKYTNNGNLATNHPDNQNLTFLANGMVKAWEQYGNSSAVIVFVVTENETNIGDQRLLEYKCIELNPSVRIQRYTLSDCFSLARLDSDKRLFIKDQEVGLVYYRAGYDPKHYNSENDWEARILIERSRAIKCPNIQLHITGAKIVQQVLSEPNTVERFIKNKEVVDRLRATFVDIHAINKENLNQILQIIEEKCHEYVLKPQREGGGNNIYKEDIKTFVNSLTDKNELMGYILMKLVRPNINENYLVRGDVNPVKKKVISELGIYGVYLANNDRFILNETGGYLLRTKSYETNEGGVASGFSALDSIYLV